MKNGTEDRKTVTNASGPGRIETRADGSLRILQLTDFHNDTSDALTEQTYGDVRRLVSLTHPDLLAVTGDIWCGDETPQEVSVLQFNRF